MTWTWDQLGDVVRRLALPPREYVLGASGSRLALGSADEADEVELLVTERGWTELEQRGWLWLTESLDHPDLDGLSASRRAHRRDYRERVPELIAQAEWIESVPVVPERLLKNAGPSEPTARRQHAVTYVLGGLLLILALGYAVQLIFGAGWQHLAFQTTEVQATVTATDEVGHCGSGTAESPSEVETRLTLSWTQGDEDHESAYTECPTDLAYGDETSAWVTSDGAVASMSGPWWAHFLGFIFVLFVMAILAITYLVIILQRWWKARHA